ncbi:MAG: LarC family nickel insertion protein [Gluconacetobacter diazotrophicus]|nr:LarC family nickel insertion protein [Gluconacetobacter diazotrophicus]
MHLHLDALGGLAGDMFAAGLLSAFPELLATVQDNVARAAPSDTRCRVAPHDDGVLAGLRFLVEDATGAPVDAGHTHHHDHDHHHGHDHGPGRDHGHEPGHHDGPVHPHDHDHGHHHDHGSDTAHGHRAWAAIRDGLAGCGLAPGVLRHALGIFGVLAEAEARVHGVAPEAVRFHEVGAADSIADVVAAATLIDAMAAMADGAGWSVSPLPLGSGRVRSAHGPMPVPAPAATVLLDGFAVHDDGVAGERVTPTGAAILRWLRDDGALRERKAAGRIAGTGVGFGTKRLPGISNCVRVLAIRGDTAARSGPAGAGDAVHRALGVVSFEVDDQSPEELAIGLERIRALEGVHDVVQMPCFGKKNRMATHVQVLARPDRLDAAVAACFAETTTIGLRTHAVAGRALPRRSVRVAVDGGTVAVKLVRRPDGTETGKAEADHLRSDEGTGQAGRATKRRQAEAAALAHGTGAEP